jgi:low affinity Fe/Cu permease
VTVDHGNGAAASWFTRLAGWASSAAGRPATFAIAVSLLVGWAVAGPLFNFSDSWQLVINTGTTIVTFLMVFLIQHTQNRDTTAIQIKLDELIRVTEKARNALIPLEDLEDGELERLRTELRSLARPPEAETAGNRRGSGTEGGGQQAERAD